MIPGQLTVAELIWEARCETQRFLRDQSTEQACAFELFRRAIVLRNEQAWSGIYELYNAVVSSWILHQAKALTGDELEALVNEVFARFYRSISPKKLQDFSCTHGLLGYLKRCAGSVVIDYWRSCQARSREEQLEAIEEPVLADPADVIAAQLAAHEFWQLICREVPNERERLILWAICTLGFSPRQLQQHYPFLFPTVDDIYRIKRNVLERLRRNKEVLQLLDQQSSRKSREVQRAG